MFLRRYYTKYQQRLRENLNNSLRGLLSMATNYDTETAEREQGSPVSTCLYQFSFNYSDTSANEDSSFRNHIR